VIECEVASGLQMIRDECELGYNEQGISFVSFESILFEYPVVIERTPDSVHDQCTNNLVDGREIPTYRQRNASSRF